MNTNWMTVGERKIWMIGVGVGCLAIAAVLLIFPAQKGSKHANASPIGPLKSINIKFDGREAALRNEILIAIDPKGSGDDLERLSVLRNVSPPLSDEESNALLAQLLKSRSPNESAGRHSELFHEIALVLREDQSARKNLARVLATVTDDKRRDRVVRDYALQHLRQVWERGDSELRKSIQATLGKMVTGRSEMAASALLSMHLLGAGQSSGSFKNRAVSDDELSSAIHDALGGSASTEEIGLKMTALRIIGDRDMKNFSSSLKYIAAGTSNEHALVRMAAITALSKTDREEGLVFLQGIDRSDPRINSAIDQALTTPKVRP